MVKAVSRQRLSRRRWRGWARWATFRSRSQETNSRTGTATGASAFLRAPHDDSASGRHPRDAAVGHLLESGLTLMRALDVFTRTDGTPRVSGVLADVSRASETQNFQSPRHLSRSSHPSTSAWCDPERWEGCSRSPRQLANSRRRKTTCTSKCDPPWRSSAHLLVGMGTVAVLLIFVIPKLVSLFQEVGRPSPCHPDLDRAEPVARGLLVAGRLGARVEPSSSTGTRSRGPGWPSSHQVALPLWGTLIKKVEIGDLLGPCHLLSHGVPILPAMQVSSATGTRCFGELQQIGDNSRGGPRSLKACVGAPLPDA